MAFACKDVPIHQSEAYLFQPGPQFLADAPGFCSRSCCQCQIVAPLRKPIHMLQVMFNMTQISAGLGAFLEIDSGHEARTGCDQNNDCCPDEAASENVTHCIISKEIFSQEALPKSVPQRECESGDSQDVHQSAACHHVCLCATVTVMDGTTSSMSELTCDPRLHGRTHGPVNWCSFKQSLRWDSVLVIRCGTVQSFPD